MMPRCRVIALLAALLLSGVLQAHPASAQSDAVSTLEGMFGRLKACWHPPALPRGHPGMEITVLFSFKRSGELLGRPRITFETPDASEADSVAYRTAVMETLQHCTPMPFTGGLGDAVAGRPFRVRFDDRRNQPKPVERRAWLLPRIL
ncbi:hypothetical protein AB7714_03655 [Tardiphaga sp. 1201_B9_N1_1]|jgi:hypothetical protein|uniref:TonB C-terminal domain-containing protein n=1 Tax=Tardiphaga robiniae TaxID=943830 RepID=A0A7G6U8K2_9BRAD|nr:MULTISPECIES: hypothetical protein [Tardiphaga]QND75334.1 hypothetical protein HB776_07180 [Tardiphaga robiniae]UFS78731.1 hypothetical protein LPB73_12385 [Tardiphaga sp. 37S4]